MNVKMAFLLNVVLDMKIYMDQLEVVYKRGMNVLCENSKKLCMGSNNRCGHDTAILSCSSSKRVFVGAKRIIICASNKRVNTYW